MENNKATRRNIYENTLAQLLQAVGGNLIKEAVNLRELRTLVLNIKTDTTTEAEALSVTGMALFSDLNEDKLIDVSVEGSPGVNIIIDNDMRPAYQKSFADLFGDLSAVVCDLYEDPRNLVRVVLNKIKFSPSTNAYIADGFASYSLSGRTQNRDIKVIGDVCFIEHLNNAISKLLRNENYSTLEGRREI